ncbi:peptidoglycan recognition protein family protein [Chitinophaga polysaccharea]|uniref:peptidoglycan recognition protein family protein n=1 Tax=Chitinophaga polysaccharea TaxID=1293035 RepID=UPI001157A3CC|nr:N-acetylmuramoyl-L-alanine amidase [Chitinophaga polysaccharea]
MKQVGKFLLLDVDEFQKWLSLFQPGRVITHVQQHHTWIPSYKHFDGNNHFKLCDSMEQGHIKRGFDEIAQNLTTFPDGKIMICRHLNKQPAGIHLANKGGICIENIGDFDIGRDVMNQQQKSTIVALTGLLLKKFNITPNSQTLVYHHWFDLETGKRKITDESDSIKTCPGTNFFGGNTVKAYNDNFLPLFK